MDGTSDSTDGARERNPLFGISPELLYTATDLQVAWGAGESLARDMAKAGFVWHSPAWRESYKFALGREIIQFIVDPDGYRRGRKGK